MKKWLTLLFVVGFLLGRWPERSGGLLRGGILSGGISVLAIECDEASLQEVKNDLKLLKKYESKCKQKENEAKSQSQTLNSAIIVLNSKINLAQSQINQTQAQIGVLEQEISLLSTLLQDLNKSLDELSVTYAARVKESYKQRDLNLIRLFFSSDTFAQLITKLRYFKSVKARDRSVLQELEKARLDYDQQKLTKEAKQQEIEELKTKLVGQKIALGGQKSQKQDLLTITKNDEKKYQSLLASARAELEAIEAIIAGKGKETEVGRVNQGDVIAYVESHRIDGDYCNSNGPHLHFMITENSISVNPFKFLKPIEHQNCSGPGPNCNPGDEFNPIGAWDWPLQPIIIFSQGYGNTWAVQNTWVSRIYSFHYGIDINSGSSNSLYAIQSGILYRGSYSGIRTKTGIDCPLKYVRVDHADSDIDTYYLHVNYF